MCECVDWHRAEWVWNTGIRGKGMEVNANYRNHEVLFYHSKRVVSLSEGQKYLREF